MIIIFSEARFATVETIKSNKNGLQEIIITKNCQKVDRPYKLNKVTVSVFKIFTESIIASIVCAV